MFSQPIPSQHQTTNIGDVFMVYVVRLQQATNYINSDNTDPLLLKLAKEDMTKAIHELAGAIRAFQSAGIFNMSPFNVPTQAFGPMVQRNPVDLNNLPWGYFNQYKGFPSQGQSTPPWVVGQQSTSMPNQMPNSPVYLNSNVLALLRFNASQLTRIDEILRSPNSDEAAKAKALQDLTEVSAEYRGIVNTLSALFEINSRTVPRAITIDNNSSFQPSLQPSLNPMPQMWNSNLSNNPWMGNLTMPPSGQSGAQAAGEADAEDLFYFIGNLGWLSHSLKSFTENFAKDLNKGSKTKFLVEKLHNEGVQNLTDIPRAVKSENKTLKEFVIHMVSRADIFSYSEECVAILLFCLIHNQGFKTNFKINAGKLILDKSFKEKVYRLLKTSPVVRNAVFKGFSSYGETMAKVLASLIILTESEQRLFTSLNEMNVFFLNHTSYIAKA